MKTDILSKTDIKYIISNFYQKLLNDKTMFPFFKEILIEEILEPHLEIITDFWQDILFHTHNYKNNPMNIHLDFHKKMNFEKKHFKIWLQYLSETIDDNFVGNNSENMKNRAISIANVMKVKMNLYSN